MKLKQILPAVVLYVLGIVLVFVGALLRFQGIMPVAEYLLVAGLSAEALAVVYTIYAVVRHSRTSVRV